VTQILTTDVFDGWFAGLRDVRAKVRIRARIDRAGLGNFGDCDPVGEGVLEMRIHRGPGYRIYFAQRGFARVRAGDSACGRRQVLSAEGHQAGAGTGPPPVGAEHESDQVAALGFG